MTIEHSIYANPHEDPAFCQSFSFWSVWEVNKWSGEDWEENSLGMKGVKIVLSEMAYVGLLVASLVEMVVRGIFALLTRMVDLFIPKGFGPDCFRNNVYGPLALGTYYSAMAVGLSAVGIIVNLLSHKAKIDLINETDEALSSFMDSTTPLATFKFFHCPRNGYKPIGI